VDPLAGSYYVEWLTNKMEQESELYFDKIEDLGGVIPAIKANFFQKEIANASYKYQKEIENNERTIVAVNQYKQADSCSTEILKLNDSIAEVQIKKLNEIKDSRNNDQVEDKLKELKKAAEGTENLMPYIIDAVREYASVGEIMNVLKEVFGVYREDSIF